MSLDESAYNLDLYDYPLDKELIAQVPSRERAESRLLCLNRATGKITHRRFSQLPEILLPDDLLVINDTQVIKARLLGRKETGGQVETLVIDYAAGMESAAKTGSFRAPCLLRASKPCRPGMRILFDKGYSARVIAANDGNSTLEFSCGQDAPAMFEEIGLPPLPPYILRQGQDTPVDDSTRYQTVYACNEGAVAAPTAGLHFSEPLLEAIRQKGIGIATVTLHVGYGTFMPVREHDIRRHTMHTERYSLPQKSADAINLAKKEGRRVIAVGTTCVRTIEYSIRKNGLLAQDSGECDLFIYPGFCFQVADGLITNFHVPRSSLLLLVSAFAGREQILAAYSEAMREKYRFFSYGDASFLA
ncbi:MAG: tRNA preQ1(34) S-adenosylmethionine ribosyltransferase-isomerase QueA [Desulfatibacillaceae bacterium]|nr:tRNA preQ1(34) S-adenosylmethionine ribosyltransferase-isomerase QueA [Desulfatibacillaceae bacterium]